MGFTPSATVGDLPSRREMGACAASTNPETVGAAGPHRERDRSHPSASAQLSPKGCGRCMTPLARVRAVFYGADPHLQLLAHHEGTHWNGERRLAIHAPPHGHAHEGIGRAALAGMTLYGPQYAAPRRQAALSGAWGARPPAQWHQSVPAGCTARAGLSFPLDYDNNRSTIPRKCRRSSYRTTPIYCHRGRLRAPVKVSNTGQGVRA
jgi:hypothetical protein